MLLRQRIFIIVIFLGFGLVLVRLFYWQIYKGEELAIQARGQQQLGKVIDATRGNILASDRSFWAASTDAWLVWANPQDLNESVNNIADKLAPLFVDDPEDLSGVLNEANRLKELLTRKDLVWVSLKQKVNSETKNEIENKQIKGIGFEREEGRLYSEASAAAHVLGFVGRDNDGNDKGYFGLEGFYDVVLSGKPGYMVREKDAAGLPIALGSSREVSAVKGVSLLTYLDKAVQLNLETKLKDGIEKYGAKAGTVIVMDPKTGGILGMVSYPAYDPPKYYNFGDQFFANPGISASYEPGSIFKVLVMASALDANLVEPETECNICNGPVRVDKYLIETWNGEYRPDSTMTEVIVNSDNVGMVFVGQKLGIQKMNGYLRNFGIGEATGIDLQGEASPALRKEDLWGQIDLATASFGQGVAVTPIQMVRAVGAIANNGNLVTPSIVEKIIGEGWEEEIEKPRVRQVISKKAATEITSMMVEAAKSGESKWTNITGFRVAGKTGTAQIPIAGHYDAEKTNASFIGFAPYDEPEFIMLVTLQEPSSSPWASETAAPLWYSIAKELFVYFGIQPEN